MAKTNVTLFAAALVHKVGPTFKPYVLSVPAGRVRIVIYTNLFYRRRHLSRLSDFKHLLNRGFQDIIQELLAYVQEEHETVVPITATGEVSSVAFHSSNPGGEKTTFEVLQSLAPFLFITSKRVIDFFSALVGKIILEKRP